MQKWIKLASLLAFLGVALGAFAAHGLKSHLSPERLEVFQTGVRYQMYHAFGLFVVALLWGKAKTAWLERAGWAFVLGILFFSGSVYLLACRDWLGIHWPWLGPITPLGGLLFLVGWAFVLVSAFQMNDR
jgi:uncharacterized membrane protein YgdD (TMEM256/DUF423 family)